jgi:uncharacterized membrane protein (UPF0127 family)
MNSLRLAVILSMVASVGAAACRDDRVTVHGDWGRANFAVTVADDNAERSQGLMFVEQMGTLEGMLFIYETPRRASFWMRNTLIPLDMLVAGPDGPGLSIHENAIPLNETNIPGGDGVQFVLEINGGLSARLGIEVGDILQHPGIGDGAAMPCEE